MCNVWFTLEFTVRFVVCPNKCIFARSLVNIIDLVATLSFYTDILLQVNNYFLKKLVGFIFQILKICG